MVDPHPVEVGRTYRFCNVRTKKSFSWTFTVCCAPGIFLLVWILSHVLDLPGCGIQPPEGLCLHRTKKHRQTANTHAFNLSGSRQLLCGHIASNKVSTANCNTECVWAQQQLSYSPQPKGHPMTAIMLSQKHDEWGMLYKHNLIFGWLIETLFHAEAATNYLISRPFLSGYSYFVNEKADKLHIWVKQM